MVDKFVEFCGAGLSSLSLADRATIANMAPEYGATCGFFPVDAETLRYLRGTAPRREWSQLVEAYCKAQGLFRTDDSPIPVFNTLLELDLATIEPSVAGPRRPQDRVPLTDLKQSFWTGHEDDLQPRGQGRRRTWPRLHPLGRRELATQSMSRRRR